LWLETCAKCQQSVGRVLVKKMTKLGTLHIQKLWAVSWVQKEAGEGNPRLTATARYLEAFQRHMAWEAPLAR
jgi:hypothetical protein